MGCASPRLLIEPDAFLAAARVARILDSLGIPYAIGGGLASIVFGLPRTTVDADLSVEIRPDQVDDFVRSLGEDFYAEPAAIRGAIERRGSFNIIELDSFVKADIFVCPDTVRAREEMSRVRSREVSTAEGIAVLRFLSPEDTLLHKLVWYRKGNEISDRQWNDLLGIIKVQGDALDRAYLAKWAGPIGVADLLERAYREA